MYVNLVQMFILCPEYTDTERNHFDIPFWVFLCVNRHSSHIKNDGESHIVAKEKKIEEK